MTRLFLMFPGQGSQYPGMGKDWFDNFKEAKIAFEEASDGCGLDLKKLCFEGSEEDLKRTEVTQPAILTSTVAVFRALEACSKLSEQAASALYAGHSLGEYSALVCAGALSLSDASRLVRHRGAYMQDAVPAGTGGMVALIYKPKTEGNWQKTQELCAEISRATGSIASPANYNSPEQIVVAGATRAMTAIQEKAVQEPWGVRKAVPLAVSAPFHCALMQPAADRLAPELQEAAWHNAPRGREYVANVDAQIHATGEGAAVAARFVSQITGGVLWVQSAQKALASGCARAVEIGPGQVLTGLMKRITHEGRSLESKSVDRWEEFKNAGSEL